MKAIGIFLFCSLLIATVLATFGSPDGSADGELSHLRQKRSTVFFPSGLSDMEEDYEMMGEELEDVDKVEEGLDHVDNLKEDYYNAKEVEETLDYSDGEYDYEDEVKEENFDLHSLMDYDQFDDNPISLEDLIINGSNSSISTLTERQRQVEFLRLLDESTSGDVMERSLGGGARKFRSGNRRKPRISILGAAMNALNPITYVRGSFNGFRNALMQNMMPFKTMFGSNRKHVISPKIITSAETTTSSPLTTSLPAISEIETDLPAVTNFDSTLSTGNLYETTFKAQTSSVNANKGLDLKIPPELVNYAALEVNLKPNGDINIVPVTTRPKINKEKYQNNNFNKNKQTYNNLNNNDNTHSSSMNTGNFVGSSNNDGTGNGVRTNTNNINNYGIGSNGIRTNTNNNNYGAGSNGIRTNTNNNIHGGGNHFNKNPQSGYPNINGTPNVVKLITDRPMVVDSIDSIQDIISLQNSVRKDKSQYMPGVKKNPIPVDFTNLYEDPSVMPNAQLQMSPPNKGNSPDHIYLLPFRVNSNKRNPFSGMHPSVRQPRPKYMNTQLTKTDLDASEIYYIDITIPEKHSKTPIVNHKRFVSAQNSFGRRVKRNTKDKRKGKNKKVTVRKSRFMEYDGWQPLDVADPMSNEPTLIYKPPPLTRVHFGGDPPDEKPLYPVKPVNPPVYVIRAEPSGKEVHSVYGTENIDYLHVNPETDSTKAFSAFGENRIKSSNDNARHVPPKRDRNSTTFSLSDIIQGFMKRETEPNVTTATPSTTESTSVELETTTSSIPTAAPFTSTEKIIVKEDGYSFVNSSDSTDSNKSSIANDVGNVIDLLNLFNSKGLTNYDDNAGTNSDPVDIADDPVDTAVDPTDITTDPVINPVDSIVKTADTIDKVIHAVDFKNSTDSTNEGDPFASIFETPPKNDVFANAENDVFTNEENDGFTNEENDVSTKNNNDMFTNEKNDLFTNIEIEPQLSPSEFTEKSLAIGEDYYYIYEDEQNKEDTNTEVIDFEDLTAESTDPFASIIPDQPNAHSYKEKSSSETSSRGNFENDEDHYYAEASENVETKSSLRAPLYELLKNFDGVQYDRYVFSASENEKSYIKEVPPINFRFRQPYPRNYQGVTGRNIGSSSKDNNNRSWYLIETRRKPEPRLKKSKPINRKNYFSSRKSPKFSSNQFIYNPYLEEHLSSFKPTESLTANSLSELLQIFKYVTTPSPYRRMSGKNSFQNKQRTFRYTKPTEFPNRGRSFTTFRYTPPVTKSVATTEPTIFDIAKLDIPKKLINDSVAETNSLDGYLFSDSEAAPEYTRLEVHPNVIRFDIKSSDKEDKHELKEDKMDQDAVQRGEIAPPFVINLRENVPQSYESSPYLIYQGHSRVKIFGSNTDNTALEITTQPPPRSSTLGHILIAPAASFHEPVTVLPPSTPSKPKIEIKEVGPSTPKDGVKYYGIEEFRNSLGVDQQLVVNKNISKWTDNDHIGAFYADLISARPDLKLPNPPRPSSSGRQQQFDQFSPIEKRVSTDSLPPSTFEAFTRFFMNYFPVRSKDAPNPSQESAQQRDSLSVPRPVFFAKREPAPEARTVSDRQKNEAKISDPYEYMSHLKMLGKN